MFCAQSMIWLLVRWRCLRPPSKTWPMLRVQRVQFPKQVVLTNPVLVMITSSRQAPRHYWETKGYIYIYARGGRFTEGSLSRILWMFKNCYFVVVKREFLKKSLLYIEWCSARTKFFWSARWLIKNPSFIHLYLWETCDLCGKMTILEMLWWSKCSKVLWATVFLEVVS